MNTLLVTGGSGFIGSEICKEGLRLGYKVISVSTNENESMRLKHDAPDINIEISDIKDSVKLDLIFKKYKPDIVVHAAAHKHVSLMEKDPQEAIQNNIVGSINVLDACVAANVKHVICISTDKASCPVSVYGQTKLVLEKLVRSYALMSKLHIVAVRFCNVYGSSGSVVELFKRQIANNEPITVTDKRMTRFFISVQEAVTLVFRAINEIPSGRTGFLNAGREVNIWALAEELKRDLHSSVPIIEIGSLPGEKLHEQYIVDPNKLGDIMIV